ncbi:N-(5'-phosphoribosyl)anthranilate isomerase [Spirochaetia bacterium]|nr:N-(5'-phosphoribosyl)anthranilate isomerase [Spirochaetia bacterium]
MSKIKICGLFREDDIEAANEAGPDYIGFVFASSKRRVSARQAAELRNRLRDGITPVGVFVNTPVGHPTQFPPEEIAALYRDGVIGIAQLHGGEDGAYIAALKDCTAAEKRGAVPVIKVIKSNELEMMSAGSAALNHLSDGADYLLFDSGGAAGNMNGGTGKSFDWNIIANFGMVNARGVQIAIPWFLAGGIDLHNIEQALALEPFAIDVSSGAETNGVKDRDKMIRLTAMVRNYGKGNKHG